MLINGYQASDLIDKLKNEEASKAIRARNLYTGRQQTECEKFLDHPSYGIRDWREKRYTPMTRNITQEIIDKSGLIFKDGLPALAITRNGDVDVSATAKFFDYIDLYQFTEKLQALDKLVRLLSSASMLIGFDTEMGKITIDLIHAGNSYIYYDARLQPETLVRLVDDDLYEIITKDFVYKVSKENHTNVVVLVDQQVNTLGIIPVAVFHDKSSPIYGAVHPVDPMLSNFNLILNKLLTLLNVGMEFEINSALYTNVELPEHIRITPGTIIKFDQQNPDDKIFLEYVKPNTDLKTLNDIIVSWSRMIAGAYCVKIEDEQASSITSGFQLIVREAANLDLRRERQRPFEAGFTRMWDVIQRIAALIGWDTTDLELTIDFPAPSLPIDEEVQEKVWTERIKEGRATRRDYLINVAKLTPDEADAKILEIKAEQALFSGV